MENELIVKRLEGNVQVITFNHPSLTNPMSNKMGNELITACRDAEQDDRVKAIILTGGRNRQFCAGGDFSEVSSMDSAEKVVAWIDWIVELYVAILSVSKPTVAALEGHAVGIGFQIALCCDWRVAGEDAVLLMPELEKGIACTFGAALLDRTLGRAAMTKIVYGCQPISTAEASKMNLLNEVVSNMGSEAKAIEVAKRFALYPEVAMRRTKNAANKEFISVVNEAGSVSRDVHCAAFEAGGAQPHFRNILNKGRKAIVGK